MIAIGCDHGGFEMKNEIISYLKSQNIECKDFGTFSEESCDYPVYGKMVAKAVSNGEAEKGILVCGTGIGMSIVANKIKGVRSASVTNEYCAEFTRKHNDLNVLCLGGRTVGIEIAKRIVDIFIHTPFEGGRHEKRVGMYESDE
jgi:ribose 5-phosphate isomerase B